MDLSDLTLDELRLALAPAVADAAIFDGWTSEAVANAARHGHASSVTARIVLAEGTLTLHIEDNGTGFPAAQGSGGPWSIRERVTSLGGELSVRSSPAGTALTIRLSRPHAGVPE